MAFGLVFKCTNVGFYFWVSICSVFLAGGEN